jgi:hypothetical protein
LLLAQQGGYVSRPATAIFLLAANLAVRPAPVSSRTGNAASLQQEQTSESPRQGELAATEQQTTSPQDAKLILPDATPVRLRFVRDVVSSQVIAGETIDLQAVQEVRVNGRIAIAETAPAKAMVTLAQAKRSMGRGGNLELKIETVLLANGESVPLRAVKDVKGGGNKGEIAGGLIASGLLFIPAAPFVFFVEGKNAVIPRGTELTAYINGDVAMDRTKFPAASTASGAAREEAAPKERSGQR